MQKLLLCALTLFSVLPGVIHAQGASLPITARDCYQAAYNAANDSLPSPMLTRVLTAPAKNLDVIGDNSYSLTDGKSLVWFYIFRSSIDRTPVAVLAYKSKLGGNCVAGILPKLDTNEAYNFEIPVDWSNSDAVYASLTKDNLFKSYRIQYPDSSARLISLLSSDNVVDQGFPPGHDLWALYLYYPGGNLICVYDGKSKDTPLCVNNVTNVADMDPVTAQPSVLPTPASTYAILRIPDLIRADVVELSLFNLNGVLLKDLCPLLKTSNTADVVLPVSWYAPGTYMLRLSTSSKRYTTPLIIAR